MFEQITGFLKRNFHLISLAFLGVVAVVYWDKIKAFLGGGSGY